MTLQFRFASGLACDTERDEIRCLVQAALERYRTQLSFAAVRLSVASDRPAGWILCELSVRRIDGRMLKMELLDPDPVIAVRRSVRRFTRRLSLDR